ncbi:hypothetical protein AB4Z35_01510 [Pseudomonas sp. KB_15]|uniref:hypothetical protein n=1 Tax=Pseudomonas sp. KB_15 TaxID=3233035 RepID=UPI003F9B2293
MILLIKETPDLTTKTSEKIIAIENILRSHGEGKHLLWMPHETISSLLKCDQFGFYSKKVLTELSSQVLETRELATKFKLKIVFDFSDQFKFSFYDGAWVLGFGHFRDSEVLQKPILLTENDDDAKIFVHGAKSYLFKEKIGNCDIKLEITSGGGDTTYKTFKRYSDEQVRFVACIIDSDKDHPKAPLGSTAKKFSKVKQGYSERQYFEMLDCHEIENILPIDLVREIASTNCKSSLIFSNPKYYKFRKYPDHKNGLTVKNAIADDFSHKDNYWADFKKHESTDFICHGFGEKLLSSCIKYFESKGERQASKLMTEDVDHEWFRIIKIIAEWGICSKRIIN